MTQSQWSFIDYYWLKYIRFFMANFIVGALAFDAYTTGIRRFPWYYSDWGAFLTMGYWILLVLQYCASDYDTTYFDFFVGTMFEVVYPVEMLITLIFWTTDYKPGTFDWSNPNTFYRPLVLHVMPIIAFTIEWFLNGRLWDISTSFYLS